MSLCILKYTCGGISVLMKRAGALIAIDHSTRQFKNSYKGISVFNY
jgi:hypothetical protein